MSSYNTCVPVYSYTPLPSNRSIRLLELHTATSFSLAIIDDLEDTPHYDALSYTWGNSACPYSQTYVDSPELNVPSIPVICDGGMILVTPNLRDALRMLSESSTSDISSHQRFNWIDAICINQADFAERAAQVELMRDLYRKAQTVYVWLGHEDEFTSDAFKAVECLSSIPKDLHDIVVPQDFHDSQSFTSKLGLSPPSPSHWLGLVAFLHRPYFKRVWVVQEVGLAYRAVVKCGLRTLPWQTLSTALQLVAKSQWTSHLHTENLRRIDFGKQLPSYQRLLSVNIDPGLSAFELTHGQSRLAASGYLLPFRRLFSDHRRCHASDPRDKIYALLGISNQDLRPFTTFAEAFRPDYNIDIQTLFTRVTRALLQSHEDLQFLSSVESRPKYTRIAGLPSWVPDFTVGLTPGPLWHRGPEYFSWCAAAGLKWRPNSRNLDDRKLQVQGIRIGEISDISDSMYNVPEPLKYWASIAQVALGVPEYYPAFGER